MCRVIVRYKRDTLAWNGFLWLGRRDGPLDLNGYKTAKHAKGNARGIKAQRPRIRAVPRSAFEEVRDLEGIASKLF